MRPVVDFLVSLMPLALLTGIAYGAWRYFKAKRPAVAHGPVTVEPGSGNDIICPNQNCAYRGLPRRRARGSVAVGLLLCCFFLLPGLIYFIARGGYRYLCPRCGLQLSSDG